MADTFKVYMTRDTRRHADVACIIIKLHLYQFLKKTFSLNRRRPFFDFKTKRTIILYCFDHLRLHPAHEKEN